MTSPRADPLERHRAAIRARLLDGGYLRAGPGSVTWTINREVIAIAGWGRAILLQLAHPLIAAGLAEHSRFRGSLVSGLTRLSSTVGAMLSLTFGTDDEAIGAAARINGIHDRVSGRLGEPAGTLDAGARYSAHDPELLRWVHATLLDSIPKTYELLIGPLSADDRDRYYAESAIMEPMLDIPDGLLPRTTAQLDAYLAEMLDGRRLVVGPRARRIGRGMLFPRGWQLLWPLFRPLQLVTIGTLPPQIRQAYGFEWRARDARAFARWTALIRILQRLVPRFARQWPVARRRAATSRRARESSAPRSRESAA